jgi:hypothetical protein
MLYVILYLPVDPDLPDSPLSASSSGSRPEAIGDEAVTVTV